MKKIFAVFIYILLLTGCDAWSVAPQPFPVWTPIPSRTPEVVTATPIILSPTPGETATPSLTSTAASIPTNTETPSPVATLPPATSTETLTAIPVQSVSVDILGCNTSIDISHGMGEVTNAYVTVKNSGNVDLPNTCSLLRALDEDREHPDKKVCIPNLPVQNQVTLKLTVDSAYQQNTIIQVDTSSNDVLLLRVDKQSCTDIGLFGGEPTDLGVIKPAQ